ncbi:unnamed protein product, partial [Mesorhabditis belari]|uniref:Chromo domain-containing protein n=1 Tax=Mesorhabditis belari TaxID=2138241 RepID=A0AAF3EBA6_9BILA
MADDVFTVEKLLKRRVVKGKVQYFVKWKGWKDSDNTWEPEENVLDERLVDEFNSSQEKQKSRKRGSTGSRGSEKKKGRKARKAVETDDESDENEINEADIESPSTSKTTRKRGRPPMESDQSRISEVVSETRPIVGDLDEEAASDNEETPQEIIPPKRKSIQKKRISDKTLKESKEKSCSDKESPAKDSPKKQATIKEEIEDGDEVVNASTSQRDISTSQRDISTPINRSESSLKKRSESRETRTPHSPTPQAITNNIITSADFMEGQVTSILGPDSGGSKKVLILGEVAQEGEKIQQAQLCEAVNTLDEKESIERIKAQLKNETKHLYRWADPFRSGDVFHYHPSMRVTEVVATNGDKTFIVDM